MAALNWSSEWALKKLLMVVVETPCLPSLSAFSSIFFMLSWDKSVHLFLFYILFYIYLLFENWIVYLLTHLCWSLACVFFINKSSTTIDCFCGSTTLPFIWKPFINTDVLCREIRLTWIIYFLLLWTYLEMTALSDFNISLVDIPLAFAIALFLTYYHK